ncbi:hypothetical protein [Bacillus glycinifermentans]|uniref:Uncharacterized protein n=1 Tax=Bacillus glycinifermentans TaxID=1664069 RepID=A0A0T6BV07_9BACI|nr:hypothetical protein [Bacillus glycinifermentans]ATH91773.1 hypothetical protein COP00_03385 [Bacillus glycinifermentans]KRT95461.1 hypothetical protein AB447_209710 [Bacillus glycinifermentans]MEC0483525.1 hypothetical protein [Bacillus glycinifermentans]MEC0492959.1 hypothetical protein [Bacillus glycinifermentans]MEC0539282.1 hypothetical protein [Bacillus glycinifermentans]
MSKIALFEALPLKKTISKRIQELLQERDSVAYVEYDKGEEYIKPAKTVDQITSELEEARKDYRNLVVLMSEANLNAKVVWDEKELSITEALELAQQLRGEANRLKSYGRSKETERLSSYSDVISYRKAMFDPEKMQSKGLKLERMANRLSNAIEKANHNYEIEFEAADKYL